MAQAQRLAGGSIAVGLAVLALKGAAWSITGSAALFSDAAETVVNVAAGVMAFAAIRFAARPADENHPYGHDKAEFFAAVVEGALIAIAAAVILDRAWVAWHHPTPLQAPLRGMALNSIGTVLNAGWAMVLLRYGRELRSAALRADAVHLFSDVITSVAVLTGVALVVATGISWLDPLAAAGAAFYILISGLRVISESVGGLMDAAPPAAVTDRIRALVSEHAAGALEAHDLRTRRSGRFSFLQFHLVVPGQMTVSEAHEICDRIEAALEAEMGDLVVTIHVEPEEKAKQHGVPVL